MVDQAHLIYVLIQLETKALTCDEETLNHLSRIVQKSLLYLGDLARYQALYSEAAEKDFSEATKHYEKAVLIAPSLGLCRNQVHSTSLSLLRRSNL